MSAAAASSITGLRRAIAQRLAVVAAGFDTLTTKSGARRAPQIIDFTLPPKTDQDVEDFPFIAVRPRVGSDDPQSGDQKSMATFDLEIGVYSDTNDGVADLEQVIDAIRLDLHESPAIAGTAFEHVGPLTWEIPFPQPRPQWLGVVTTNWQIPRPRRIAGRNPTED
jgi:hypothetical protein